MSTQVQYPTIPRNELLDKLRKAATEVHNHRQSCAVMIFGDGGVGKTSFLRNLPEDLQAFPYIQLGPYDVDDAEYWLLPNLERRIAHHLDPQMTFFQSYFDHQHHFFDHQSRRGASHDIDTWEVLAYSRKSDKVFFECFQAYVNNAGITPILIFDTVESIRGLGFQFELIRWIEKVTSALVVFASRRPDNSSYPDAFVDSLKQSTLTSVQIWSLDRFTDEQSRLYLQSSHVGAALSEQQLNGVVHMAEGYPLRLALSVAYYAADSYFPEIETWVAGNMGHADLRDAFLYRLTVPHRSGDFWFEAIKRLGVVRRRVNFQVWQELMADCTLPDEMSSWTEAWSVLLEMPWVRTRANKAYVTLHDAFAEILAKNLIVFEDHNHEWRKKVWKRATLIYQKRLKQEDIHLQSERKELNESLKQADIDLAERFLDQAMTYSVRETERYLLESTAFYYHILSDREGAISEFLKTLQNDGKSPHQLVELKFLELQQFLPGSTIHSPLEDVIRPEIIAFRQWYAKHSTIRYEVESKIAKYLLRRGTPKDALPWLDGLIETTSYSPTQAFQLFSDRANARLRVFGLSSKAFEDFSRLRELAQNPESPPEVKERLNEAFRNLGYYFRVVGDWEKSAEHYRLAVKHTSLDPKQRTERALIQYHYGFILALRGRYPEAQAKADLALDLALRLGNEPLRARVLNAKANIDRMAGAYESAYEAVSEAESLFVKLENDPWLGIVRQSMAICMYEAAEKNVRLLPYKSTADILFAARELAYDAVRLCRSYQVLSLPRALYRAGHILSLFDHDEGLAFFYEGNEIAIDVTDRWMRIANGVDFASLAYNAWIETGDFKYRLKVDEMREEINAALSVHGASTFIDFRGRWEVIQANCKTADGLAKPLRSEELYEEALKLYVLGFLNIARGSAPLQASRSLGSLSSRSLDNLSRPFYELLKTLPQTVLVHWLDTLDREWRNLPDTDAEHVAPLSTLVGKLDVKLRA